MEADNAKPVKPTEAQNSSTSKGKKVKKHQTHNTQSQAQAQAQAQDESRYSVGRIHKHNKSKRKEILLIEDWLLNETLSEIIQRLFQTFQIAYLPRSPFKTVIHMLHMSELQKGHCIFPSLLLMCLFFCLLPLCVRLAPSHTVMHSHT